MPGPINIARAVDVLGKHREPRVSPARSTETRDSLSTEAQRASPEGSATGGMNKTEARFAEDFLTDRICSGGRFVKPLSWLFGSIKLRLADKTWYTPDFFVFFEEETFVYEVKGSWKSPHQEDSRVKLKVAAELYPQFTFFAAVPNRETGGWDIEEIPCRARQ